jgi:hypothetical protein
MPDVSNPFIKGLSVEQLYEVLAGSFGGFTGANCRAYLQVRLHLFYYDFFVGTH